MTHITIDDQTYALDDLTEDCKAQLASLRFADAEIQRLQSRLALAQTARNAYAQAVKAALPE